MTPGGRDWHRDTVSRSDVRELSSGLPAELLPRFCEQKTSVSLLSLAVLRVSLGGQSWGWLAGVGSARPGDQAESQPCLEGGFASARPGRTASPGATHSATSGLKPQATESWIVGAGGGTPCPQPGKPRDGPDAGSPTRSADSEQPPAPHASRLLGGPRRRPETRTPRLCRLTSGVFSSSSLRSPDFSATDRVTFNTRKGQSAY